MRSADPDTLDDWRSRSDTWNTDIEDPPIIRARVIHPDGQAIVIPDGGVDIGAGDTSNDRDARRRYSYEAPELRTGSIFEEEIPREGIRVTRNYQLTRWQDGSTHLWIGRRKVVGSGEGSSGLQFDMAKPVAPAPPVDAGGLPIL